MANVKIIFVIGCSHSGSSLVGQLLNKHSEICNVGELAYLTRDLRTGKTCSCNQEYSNCQFWLRVLKQLSPNELESVWTGTPVRKLSWFRRFLLITPLFDPDRIWSNLFINKFIQDNTKLYETIAKEANKSVIIDTSKNIYRAFLMHRFSNLEVQLIYIHRQGQAFIDSKKRRKKYSLFKSLVTLVRHKLMHMRILTWVTGHSVVYVSYDEIAKHPEKSLKDLFDFLRLPNEKIVEKKDDGYMLKKESGHTIGGNGLRFDKQISIKYRDKWKISLSPIERLIYILVGGSLLDFYFESRVKKN